MRRLSPSREQRIRRLPTLEEMGKRKPSSFSGTSEASHQTCQTTSSAAFGPAGYPQGRCHSRRPLRGRLGRRGPLCGPYHRGRTPAGARECYPTPRQRCISAAYRGPLRPGKHSAPSGPALNLAPGTAGWATDPPPEPRRKSVLSPTPTASKEINAAEINGGTCTYYNHRQPLHYGEAE